MQPEQVRHNRQRKCHQFTFYIHEEYSVQFRHDEPHITRSSHCRCPFFHTIAFTFCAMALKPSLITVTTDKSMRQYK